MKIDLPVRTRATLQEFIDAYTPYFLMKYGYREYSHFWSISCSIGVFKAI